MVHLPHISYARTMIRVSRCRILRCSISDVSVHQYEGAQVSLDIHAFVHQLVAFFKSARKWSQCDMARAIKERPAHFSLENGFPREPVAPLALLDAQASIGVAIVPFAPARVPQPRDVSDSITALSRLHKDISVVGGGSIDRSRISGCSSAYIDNALVSGVLRLVGDDSDRIALNMRAVD